MTDTATPFEVFRCPSCGKPGKESFERCRHCGVNYKTGQVDGFAARTFSGGGTSLPFLGGAFLTGFAALGVITTVAINRPASSPAPTSVQGSAAIEATSPTVSTPPLPTVTYTAAQRSMICRAAIGKMMGRDPNTMATTGRSGGLVRVQYRRPDDNKLWKSECRLEGNRIIWRGIDSFGNDGPGRWRDLPEDETLTFSLKGTIIAIAEGYSDGTSSEETFRF